MSNSRWTWGMGNPRYWVNRDLPRSSGESARRGAIRGSRPAWVPWDLASSNRKIGFIINLGRLVSPIVAPEDPGEFESVVRDLAHLGPSSGNPARSLLI